MEFSRYFHSNPPTNVEWYPPKYYDIEHSFSFIGLGIDEWNADRYDSLDIKPEISHRN